MSFIKSTASAFGKLFIVMILAAAFLFGMGGVVYMSLQGEEIKVPELVGKDFVASEAELDRLGLKIKRRADRVSNEKQNTILEQLPKPGETVKTGQMILVVVSKENPDGIVPDTLKKDEGDDIEKIEELISDKPVKTNKSTDAANKKKSSKTRDVIANKPAANKAEISDKPASNGDDRKPASTGDKPPVQKPPVDKPGDTKPAAQKPPAAPGASDTRPRRTP